MQRNRQKSARGQQTQSAKAGNATEAHTMQQTLSAWGREYNATDRSLLDGNRHNLLRQVMQQKQSAGGTVHSNR